MPKDIADMKETEWKRLLEFCRSHRRIFVYGAGGYAKYFFLLEDFGICVDAFITTQKAKEVYCGKKVYSVQEIGPELDENDGVIPGFQGAAVELIRSYLRNSEVDVYEGDALWIRIFVLDRFLTRAINEGWMSYPTRKFNIKEWNEILIIRLDAIGDTVCTIPMIRNIKNNLPNAKISVLIQKQNYDILKNCPYIDKIYLFDGAVYHENMADAIENYVDKMGKMKLLQKQFADRHFDAVILPVPVFAGRGSLETFLISQMVSDGNSVGNVKIADQYTDYLFEEMRQYFSRLVPIRRPLHEIDATLEILRQCGMEVKDDYLELWDDDTYKKAADARFIEWGTKRIYVCVGVVGSVDVNSWRPENYKSLFAAALKKYGDQICFLLFGGKDAGEAAQNIEGLDNVIDLTGQLSLGESIAYIKNCDLYMGSNTGLMHIAAAWQKPCITLYSTLSDATGWDGSNPNIWGVRHISHIDLIPQSGLDGCTKYCRMRYSHCINQITPEDVLAALDQMIFASEEAM